MKFKSIKFNNYRCFLDEKMEFNEDDKQNITLIIGPNGGGKTETLYAFWWVLYDFDFNNLRGKEDTPYALNSDLYKQLEKSKVGTIKSCEVEMRLEHNNVEYVINKRADFRKTDKKVVVDTYQTVSEIEEFGGLSLPIRDTNKVRKILNSIIPKPVLSGLVFDGERMKKLSSLDEESKMTIKGLINDITNVELIERCINVNEELLKGYRKEQRKIARKKGDQDYDDLSNDIDSDENELRKLRDEVQELRELLVSNEEEQLSISEKLKTFQETSKLERERDEKKVKSKDLGDEIDLLYKDFSDSLKDGYQLIMVELLDEVLELLELYDVPVGLTVEAVKSIIKRDECICGNVMSKVVVEKLDKLIATLPPDNMNSTIAEIIRQLKIQQGTLKKTLDKEFKLIRKKEREKISNDGELASLSAQILEVDLEEATSLENENQQLIKDQLNYETDIRVKSELSLDTEKALIDKKKRLASLGEHNEEIKQLQKYITYIEKSIKAFDMIKDINKSNALDKINENIRSAYQNMSEDYDLGRRIYIVKYDPQKQYQIIVYLKNNVDTLINEWKESGEYQNQIDNGTSEEVLMENAILMSSDSNSTGQSKMNTLSFVKAILDYSNNEKTENVIGVTKKYPLLIDAPFGDIFEKNLINSSKELHNFSEQVIMMLSRESYTNVKAQIEPYIKSKYILSKKSEENNSSLYKEF